MSFGSGWPSGEMPDPGYPEFGNEPDFDYPEWYNVESRAQQLCPDCKRLPRPEHCNGETSFCECDCTLRRM